MIIDLHQDLSLSFFDNPDSFFWSEKSSLNESCVAWSYGDYVFSNTSVLFSAIWPYDESFKEPKASLTQYQLHLSCYNSFCSHQNISQLKSKRDLDNVDSYGLSLLYHLEWCDFFWSIDDFDRLFSEGVRSVWLVWNYSNKRATAHKDSWWLTLSGFDAVERLHSLWIIIDVAHMSNQSMLDVLSVSHKPIINSHSNIESLFSHSRNVSDEFLLWLSKNWGLLWLSLYNKFIWKDTSSFADYIRQIDYVRNKIWDEHIALGSDLHGIPLDKTPIWISWVSSYVLLQETIIKTFWSTFAEKFFYKNTLNILSQVLV